MPRPYSAAIPTCTNLAVSTRDFCANLKPRCGCISIRCAAIVVQRNRIIGFGFVNIAKFQQALHVTFLLGQLFKYLRCLVETFYVASCSMEVVVRLLSTSAQFLLLALRRAQGN